MKKQFVETRAKFRDVMDKVRTREYETFRQLDIGKDYGDRHAYNAIEEEKRVLKERFKRMGDSKVLINNLFAQTSDNSGDEAEQDDKKQNSDKKEASG